MNKIYIQQHPRMLQSDLDTIEIGLEKGLGPIVFLGIRFTPKNAHYLSLRHVAQYILGQ